MRKFPEAPRVVHISPAAFGDEGIFGGGERYPFELAKAMAARGLGQATVISPTRWWARGFLRRIVSYVV